MALDSTWRKSTFSSNGSCVEVRRVDAAVEVRDTKDRTGPVLSIPAKSWQELVEAIRAGDFDLT